MNRRSFFQLVTGTIASVYAACVPKTKRDIQATEIKEFGTDIYGTPDEMYGKSPAAEAIEDISKLERLRANIIKTQEELLLRRHLYPDVVIHEDGSIEEVSWQSIYNTPKVKWFKLKEQE
ncbi:hypothetical protein LCGC14_1841550 [marine sediment metagenome]|uniref:Uncharacterized protein n=1 Tax=marine sediment metagenome TaxID=412755 RepID=A0A0F9GD57_9ZZZZ